MKRFLFFILFVCSLGAMSSNAKYHIAQESDTIAISDSLDLFRDLTDISKQVERRVSTSEDIDNTSVTELLSSDLVIDSIVSPSIASLYDSTAVKPEILIKTFKNPLDSLYKRTKNGTLQLPLHAYNTEAMRGLTFRDTLFYSPLFLPMIFTGQVLPRELSLYSATDTDDSFTLIPFDKTFDPNLRHLDFVIDVRRNYYMNYPDRIRYSVTSFDSIPSGTDNDEKVRESFNPFKELVQTESTYSLDAPGVEKATIDRKYWTRSGENSFHFSQNHFSENWHKGGTNNLNFNSQHVLKANYRKDKVKFNNTLEWKLSVFNSPDDTLRQYRIGNDLLRYYGNFGLDAFLKGWSYSMNLEAKSQMFKNYPVNSKVLRSSLLSPLYVNAGVGLTYNLDKKSEKVRHRRVRWDLALAPVSVSYRYVMNDDVDVVRYGIPKDEKSLLDIGTTITSNLTYDITRYITWKSRLTYFTAYDKVQSEFENTLDMALSNAFSTIIYLHLRFDDSVPPDSNLKYWQYNQTLSFGLNYKW